MIRNAINFLELESDRAWIWTWAGFQVKGIDCWMMEADDQVCRGRKNSYDKVFSMVWPFSHPSYSQTRMSLEVIAFALRMVQMSCNFVALWRWARNSEGSVLCMKVRDIQCGADLATQKFPTLTLDTLWPPHGIPAPAKQSVFNFSLHYVGCKHLINYKLETNGLAWPTLHAPAFTSLISHFFHLQVRFVPFSAIKKKKTDVNKVEMREMHYWTLHQKQPFLTFVFHWEFLVLSSLFSFWPLT